MVQPHTLLLKSLTPRLVMNLHQKEVLMNTFQKESLLMTICLFSMNIIYSNIFKETYNTEFQLQFCFFILSVTKVSQYQNHPILLNFNLLKICFVTLCLDGLFFCHEHVSWQDIFEWISLKFDFNWNSNPWHF